ncbi:hypothetical protein BC829DRAFT_492793 [Chytridium lagenaria]|nr:hypothetical protein BC829DRAFT_492793 [Chytridium lagenaria]
MPDEKCSIEKGLSVEREGNPGGSCPKITFSRELEMEKVITKPTILARLDAPSHSDNHIKWSKSSVMMSKKSDLEGEEYDDFYDDDSFRENGSSASDGGQRSQVNTSYRPSRRNLESTDALRYQSVRSSIQGIKSPKDKEQSIGSLHSRSTGTLGRNKFPHSRELTTFMNSLLIWLAFAMKKGANVSLSKSLVQSIGPISLQVILIVMNMVTIHVADMAATIFLADKLTSKGYSMASCGFMHKKPLSRFAFSNQLSLNSPCRMLLSRMSLIWIILEGMMILSPFGASGVSVESVREIANMVPCILLDSSQVRDRLYPSIETSLGVAEFIFGDALGCMRSQSLCTDQGSQFAFGPQLVGAIKDGDTIVGPGYTAFINTHCDCYNVSDAAVVEAGLLTPEDQRTLLNGIIERDFPFAMVGRVMNQTTRGELNLTTIYGKLSTCGGYSSEFMSVCTTTISQFQNSQIMATFLTDGTTASIALVHSDLISIDKVQTANISSIAQAIKAVSTQGQLYNIPSTTPGMMSTLMYWSSSNLISIDPALFNTGVETHIAILLRAAFQRTFRQRGSSCPRKINAPNSSFVFFQTWASYSVLICGITQLLFTVTALGYSLTWLTMKRPITPAMRGTANAQEHVLWQNLDVVVKIGESVDTIGEVVGKIRMDSVKMVRDLINGREYC